MDRAEERAKDLCETYDATPSGVPWQAIAKEIRLAIKEESQATAEEIKNDCLAAAIKLYKAHPAFYTYACQVVTHIDVIPLPTKPSTSRWHGSG